MQNKIKIKIILIYLFFWIFWIFYSYLAGYSLEFLTTFIIITSFVGFLVGWSLKRKKEYVKLTFSPHKKIKNILMAVVVSNIILLLFSLSSIAKNGFEHRYLMFSDDGLFGNIWLTLFINYFIQPLTLAAIVISVAIKSDGTKYYYYTYGLLAVMSLLTLGRFPIYYIIYFYAIRKLLQDVKSGTFIEALKYILITICILYISWILLESKLIDEASNVINITDILRIYVLNYHIVGYHMLDNFISTNATSTTSYVYPTTSLGFIGWITHLLTKYSMALPTFPNSYMNLMETYNGGIYLDKLQWTYNAFTTSILPLYADGGIMGVFFGFLIYGIISTRSKNLDCYRLNPMFLLVLFMLTFSLFQPFINSSLPLSMFFIWLINKFLLRKSTLVMGR
jgi:oligosaccharide repeat unit polymerase